MRIISEKQATPKGRFIGIIGDNGPEWVIAFMAVQWIGGVVVPLDLRAKEMELSHIIEHSGLRTIFASPRLVGLLKGMIQSGDLKRKTLLISLQEIDGCDHLPQVFSAFKDDARREKVSLEDLAIVQYTSGTTGNPKGVMLTHKNLSSNINSLYQAVVFDQRDRFFSVLPIHHVYEGTAGNWLPLSVGASITYSRSLKSKEMLEDARDTEPTVMLAVPLLLGEDARWNTEKIGGFTRICQKTHAFIEGMRQSSQLYSKTDWQQACLRGIEEEDGIWKVEVFCFRGALPCPPGSRKG